MPTNQCIVQKKLYIYILFPFLFHFKFFSCIFISWRLGGLKYCSGFYHTLTWISHRFTCTPHPDPPSHLPLHPIPLGLPSAPGPSTCLMHPTWAGDLFHPNAKQKKRHRCIEQKKLYYSAWKTLFLFCALPYIIITIYLFEILYIHFLPLFL